MSLDAVDIVNAATLEKVVLSQRVASFLKDANTEEERTSIENIARLLAQDVAVQVREALAFELRTCAQLPHDIAVKLAADIESVSSPFLASTEVFSDAQLAELVPHLEEHAHVTLARRSDIGPNTCHTIITVGSEKSVRFIIRNSHVTLYENSCDMVVQRFGDKQTMMDHLSCRIDLPLSIVEQLITKVSEKYYRLLVKTYDLEAETATTVSSESRASTIARQIENASPAQIHAYVIDLRKSGRLTHTMVLEMAKKGCLNFLESMLALEAGLTLVAVRTALYSGDMREYIRIMQQAGVSRFEAMEYRKIVLLKGKTNIH